MKGFVFYFVYIPVTIFRKLITAFVYIFAVAFSVFTSTVNRVLKIVQWFDLEIRENKDL